jgi:hypothetical protein
MLNYISNHFLKLSLVFYVFGIAQSLVIAYGDQSLNGLFSWKLTQFYVSYFDFGFIKRGVVGTLLYPVFNQIGGQVASAAIIIVFVDFLLFVLLLVLLKRVMEKHFPANSELMKVIKTIIVLSPVGVMQLSYDTGRLDHLNFILAGYALMLLLDRRFVLAGMSVAVGVLVHEAIFLFGFPVLMAVCLSVIGKNGSLSDRIRPAVGFGLLPVLAAGLVVFRGNSGVDLASVLPPSVMQGANAWGRAVFQPSLGLSIQQYIVLLFYLVMPYVLLRKFYQANRLEVDLIFIFALSPLSLFAVGIDYARWTHLAFVSVLIAIFFHVANGRASFSVRELGFPKFGLFLYVLPLGPIGITRAWPYVESILLRILGNPAA